MEEEIKQQRIPSGDIRVGSVIAYLNGEREWVECVVTRVSKTYVWFVGSGYARIRRTTFDSYPQLYRIIAL